MKLDIGSISLPLSSATKTFAILAKRGAGKTYTAGVMAEEFSKANIPFVVFDPIDVWWGLRLSENGKGKGLPIVVFGKEHADIPLDRDMGRKIAQAVVRDNVSCVISTFGLPKVAQRHLIAEFAEELLNINNTPRHVFVEEAHEFVPQRVFGGLSKTFAAVESLVVMGRNRGIGVTLINQRAATVNKDVLTQLDTLIALRNVGPQDRKALEDWVEAHSAEGDFEKFISTLPSLPTGEAWIWSPEFLSGMFERIKIRKRETFHPDREKLGSKFVMPALDQADIQGFISKFSKDIATVKVKEVKGKKAVVAFEPQVTPQPVVDVQAIRNEYESRIIEKDNDIRALKATIAKVAQIVGSTTATEGKPLAGGMVNVWLEKLVKQNHAHDILQFLAEHQGMPFTRGQIAVQTGYSAKSSSFSIAMSNLKKWKLIVETNDGYTLSPNL